MEHEGDGDIALVIRALGTVFKELVNGLKDLEMGILETIQITALRSTRILRRVPETWADLPSFNLSW